MSDASLKAHVEVTDERRKAKNKPLIPSEFSSSFFMLNFKQTSKCQNTSETGNFTPLNDPVKNINALENLMPPYFQLLSPSPSFFIVVPYPTPVGSDQQLPARHGKLNRESLPLDETLPTERTDSRHLICGDVRRGSLVFSSSLWNSGGAGDALDSRRVSFSPALQLLSC